MIELPGCGTKNAPEIAHREIAMKQVQVAIGIIHQAGWVLICQRRQDATFANLWEFPGGKVEAGESPQDCVVREVTEELGFSVKPTAAFPVIEHRYPDLAVKIYPYLCMPVAGHPRPLACQRMQWVAAERLVEFPFPAANTRLIPQIVLRLSSCDIPAFCETANY
jgi:mutator protein MutT